MPTTLAFSPEAIRSAIRGRVAVPAAMLQRALAKTSEKLDAKETKFFSHQGLVIDKKDVEAHNIQLRAAELILQMSDLLNRQVVKPKAPKITLTVDPKTGTMRLVIADDIEDDIPEVLDVVREPLAVVESEEVTDEELELEYVKVPRGTLPAEVRQALFGPEVGGA